MQPSDLYEKYPHTASASHCATTHTHTHTHTHTRTRTRARARTRTRARDAEKRVLLQGGESCGVEVAAGWCVARAAQRRRHSLLRKCRKLTSAAHPSRRGRPSQGDRATPTGRLLENHRRTQWDQENLHQEEGVHHQEDNTFMRPCTLPRDPPPSVQRARRMEAIGTLPSGDPKVANIEALPSGEDKHYQKDLFERLSRRNHRHHGLCRIVWWARA